MKETAYPTVEVITGKNTAIYPGATIGIKTESCDEPVILEDGAKVHSGVVLYAGCKIGKNSEIFHNTILMERTIVGDDCKIGTLCHSQGNMSIGNFVTLASHVHLTSFMKIEDGAFISMGVFFANHSNAGGRLHQVDLAEISAPVIKRGARIGAMSVICPGVSIGQEAFIGAGSVVRKDIPDFMIAVGAPCKPIRRLREEEMINWEGY